MVLLGLSILVASITFIYYRRPPFALSLLTWFRRPSISTSPSIPLEDVSEQRRLDSSSESDIPPPPIVEIPSVKENANEVKHKGSPTRAEDDRKAMPPPPPPFQKPSSPTTPRVSEITSSTTQTIPFFNLAPSITSTITDYDEEDDIDNLPPPSFPAVNSAQRAKAPTLNALPTTTPKLTPPRQGGLMLPPSRPSLPLPNRGPPPPSAGGLAPPPTHSAPPTKPRKKVLLTPGHSPLDWARLTSSREFLASQPSSLIRVPPSLLKMHNGRRRKVGEGQYVIAEAWTVLGGKVYNITPYIPYHPGGEPELLRVAGKDGTKLFGEVHPWVNFEGMLENCLVGIAVDEEVAEKGKTSGGGLEDMD